jgi:DNA-binding transcriptional regulator GbsR (MarR family)
MKNTKVNAVKALMDADKNISVKEICDKTGFSKSQVYVIRSYLKNKGKKLTPVNKTTKAKRGYTKPTDSIKRLQTDLAEMQRLAMYWKQAYHELEIKSRGNVAVIQYLESKIAQLFKD